ncbi:MAG: TonB-dependent receptor [Chitinophagales bacterium]
MKILIHKLISLLAFFITALPAVRAQFSKDSFNLKEVVVTGTLKELRREDFAIPVEIYTQEYFQSQNVFNLQDAIRFISGLQANIDGCIDGAADIEINGLEGTYALVLLDGAPITGGTGNLYGLMGIPLSIIDRIEVIKGPASTLYGTEAVAGVVNVITKSPEHSNKVSIDSRLTSYLETGLDASVTFKEGKANGLLGVSYFGMNKKWDFNKDNFTDIPLQNRLAFINKWTFRNRVNKQSSILARYIWDDRTGGQLPYSKTWRGSDSIYGEAVRTNRFELVGNFLLPIAKANVSLMLGFSHHHADAAYGTNLFRHNEQNGYLQLIYDNKITKKSDFLIGIAYRFNRYDDNLVTTADTANGKYINHPIINHYPAIFIQDMIHVNENHEILAGLRLEYNTLFTGVAFAPRFDYKWMSTNKKNELRLGIESGYRTPNAFIDNKYAFTSGRKIVLDEKLKTETCYGFHTDYIRKFKTEKLTIFWESRLYFNFLFNMVELEIDYAENTITYENENSYGLNAGFNTMVEMSFEKPVKLQLGINLLGNFELEKEEGEDEIELEPLINSPILNATFGLQYHFKRAGVKLDWSGYVNSPMRMAIQDNDPRGEYSPWYTIQNIQCSKQFAKGFELLFGIQNIFNTRPPQPILRPFDPFNKSTTQNGLVFDATYNYAPNQGARGFVGIRFNY